VSPASASIDAHGRFIENRVTNVVSVFYIAPGTGTSRLMTSHYLRMPRKSAMLGSMNLINLILKYVIFWAIEKQQNLTYVRVNSVKYQNLKIWQIFFMETLI
jgi:hypothetical protein